MQNIDHRDTQVKGLDRYIPSKIAKTLLVLFITNLLVTLFTFFNGSDNTIKTIFGRINVEDPLKFLLLTLVILASALIVELAVIINHSKHSRVKHFSQEHPLMSFKMLVKNATTKHYLFLFTLFLSGLLIGGKYL
ncbi:hypothetical protein L1285_23390 [Pseudoalteromonas sp. DL2-H2.2]|uniref:hypothetical protein n=1 Tax=Pseudoalteromonas sp. DL2-H2.2 TaxID=2908889 RepID=UPI001F46BC94|nr:hypothetical protein [Pseudoalteromonas sp. DL2-H2.2]MCF2911247.1 hypothetical protein [Pseudoalteromonas sp. DL2-H2.2]